MTNRSKNIGTAGETAVARYLVANGFPHAERRTLHGAVDLGDITGTPGLVWEVKAGKAAASASDRQVAAWLVETERERRHAQADIGILVMRRAGIGPTRAGGWWAVLPYRHVRIGAVTADGRPAFKAPLAGIAVRMHLADVVIHLRDLGYGHPLAASGYTLRDGTDLTAKTWAEDLADASRRAAEAKFGPMFGNTTEAS